MSNHSDSDSDNNKAYSDFQLQYIAGEWQQGQDDSVNTDTNPYNGETLVEIKQATKDQLDEAYKAAETAQIEWAQTSPAERGALLHKVVSILDKRQEEIIDWLVKESGSTRIKAMVEFGSARAITVEAAGYSQMKVKLLYRFKRATGINFTCVLRSQRLRKIHPSSAILFL